MISKRKPVRLLFALICLAFAAVLLPQSSFAVNTAGNITADSVTKIAAKGDEVRIEVSSKKMTISTFIASIEYDPEMLEYKGYEGTAGKDSVYLSDASDKDVHFDISVERSESEPVIGMYAVGTSEKKYSAAKPLITFIFKVKKDGDVYYRLSESTSGKDGYTSPDIQKRSEKSIEFEAGEDDISSKEDAASEETRGVDAGTTVDAHSARNYAFLKIAGVIAVLALIISASAIIILRRKNRLKDK